MFSCSAGPVIKVISHPFITGLLVGFSLIIAFGAQNIFVLNHGLMRLYVFPIVLFCSLADFTLIWLGIAGIDYFEDSLELYKAEILAFAASWLFLYAIFKLKSAVVGDILRENSGPGYASFGRTLGTLFIVTFGNPHVYIDTMLLIGTISMQFSGVEKSYYGLGACLASLIFFFSLGYLGVFLGRFLMTAWIWRLIDIVIATILLIISLSMLKDGGWIKV